MSTQKSAFENVTITLEHDIDEQYQYQPGEIIRGRIGLHLHRQAFVQTIFVTIQGDGVVSWEDENAGSFQSAENYLDASQVVFDSEMGRPQNLDQGFHDFDFEYQLPSNIPSSFIGKYGSVTYILKAVVQGEKRGDTTLASEPFLVLRKFVPPVTSTDPVDRKAAKRFVRMCSFGKIIARIRIDKTSYTPGEDIFIQAEVQNQSPLRVTAIQGALAMDNVYHAQKHSIPFRQLVNKRRDEYELTDGDGRRWQQVRLSIPPYIPESYLEFCDIIELSYEFEFRVELSGGKELRIKIPVFVGSNTRKLPPVPGETEKDVNIHWTMGPKELARNGHAYLQEHETKKWDVVSPEFRQPDEQVTNPLFMNESQHKGKHDTKEDDLGDGAGYHDNGRGRHDNGRHHSSKHRDFDDRHKHMGNTKL